MSKELGARISEALKTQGITQKELALRIGVTEAVISRYISGDREPKPEVLANMATALHVTSDYLLGTEQDGDLESDYPRIIRLIARNAAGMTAQQKRNIINALGLSEFLDWSDIYISDEVGHLKTTPYSFEKIMAAYPDCQYLYVGDNPAKDFLVPNRLGWMTVCVLDNGQNIHPQDFTLSVEYLPQRKIKDITELLEIID